MISVCILAKNAEKTIANTFQAALELGDEIVVRLDRSSEDSTRKIIYELKNHVEHMIVEEYDFIGFGSARNGLVHAATKPWIFMLDADETIASENIGIIRGMIRNGLRNAIYTFPRHNWVDFECTSYREDHYPDHQARLFPSGGGVNYGEQMVHEMPHGLPYMNFPVKHIHIEHFCFAVRGDDEWRVANHFYADLREQERARKT